MGYELVYMYDCIYESSLSENGESWNEWYAGNIKQIFIYFNNHFQKKLCALIINYY